MTKKDFECQNGIFGPNLNVRIGFQMCIFLISIMYLNEYFWYLYVLNYVNLPVKPPNFGPK